MSLRHLSRTCIRVMQGLRERPASVFKSSTQSAARARSSSENPSAGPNQVRRLSSAVEHQGGQSSSEYVMKRQTEKAENVRNLVCWGPGLA